jgi:hypothetical protein
MHAKGSAYAKPTARQAANNKRTADERRYTQMGTGS